MGIIYDDISALEFYRTFERRPHRPLSAWECRSILKEAGEDVSPTALDRRNHAAYGVTGELGRIHLLVPEKACTRKSDRYAYRIWDPPLGRDSLLAIGEDVYVVSAEMLFLRMAQKLDWLSLALLGLELCGCYVVKETGERRREPLATPASLALFVERHAGKEGAKKAKRALQYVLANSYSPMESRTFLLLCLPRVVGGYGLPFPEFNARIDVPAALAGGRSDLRLKGDLYWDNCHGASLAAEYDSDEHHSGDKNVLRDTRRAATLASMGVVVINLRKDDVYYADAFDAAAAKIAYALKVKHGPLSGRMRQARVSLRKSLLFSDCIV